MTRMLAETTPPPRTRSRAIDVGEPANVPQPTHEMTKWATTIYQRNQTKNKNTRDESAGKKALAKLMAAAELKRFSVRFGTKDIDVKYEPTSGDAVDPAALLKAVGLEKFMTVAKVTMGDVKEEFGNNVAAKVTVTVVGDHKLSVKERK